MELCLGQYRHLQATGRGTVRSDGQSARTNIVVVFIMLIVD